MKLKQPFANENGVGLLALILVVSALIASIVVATSIFFAKLQMQVVKQRDRSFAIQALQEFAVMAQKANDNYVNNANTCPAGTTAGSGPAAFCWSGASIGPSTTICIKDPRSNAGTQQTICLDTRTGAGVSRMGIAQFDIRRNITPWERFKEVASIIYEEREKVFVQAASEILATLDSQAHAVVGMEAHLPDLTGVPTNTINNPSTCDGTVNNDYCKVCGVNVTCIELRICLAPSAQCDNTSTALGNWFRQRIGILNRT